MLESIGNRGFQFKELSPEEKESRGILGRLYGTCADFMEGTRNNRKYSERLWERVFNDPIVNEMFEAGGVPGELDHPIDRQETDSSKIAVMMPEKPVKDKDGHLKTYFDIIDTPCGKIAYALAKYGFKLGISSRGSGDIYEDENGDECVDEDTYEFNGFDVVLCPSVKDARMTMTESLDQDSRKGLHGAIAEALDKSTADDKKIIMETLKDLNIDYPSEKTDDKATKNESKEADNDGSEILKELQESLKEQQSLKKCVANLQEQLSVCNAKEVKIDEITAINKELTEKVSKAEGENKALTDRVRILAEKLEKRDSKITNLNTRVNALLEDKKKSETKKNSITESIESKDSKISTLETKIKKLNESIQKSVTENESKRKMLEESISNLKKDSALKQSEFTSKLEKEKQLSEKYQRIAKKAVARYIESKATLLGVEPKRITEKLQRGYSFEDIDDVCESLQRTALTIDRLPFSTSTGAKKVKMKVTESKETIVNNPFDDDVDSSLMDLVNKM